MHTSLNSALLDPIANADDSTNIVPEQSYAEYFQAGLTQASVCLPGKTQFAMAALLFQAILNTLPLAVIEILSKNEAMDANAHESLALKIGPVLAIMLVFTPLEMIQTYLHTTWRAINPEEPSIQSTGDRSAAWVATLLIPSLISSFITGALTAKAGFSTPSIQALMALVLGSANMLKTLLGSIIPEWRILAHLKNLAPLNMQPVLESLFHPKVLAVFNALYVNLAPPLMGGVYANFVYAETLKNIPGIAGTGLAVILGLYVFETCAAVTQEFDVKQVVESCEAFAKALREAAVQTQGLTLSPMTTVPQERELVPRSTSNSVVTLSPDTSHVTTSDAYLRGANRLSTSTFMAARVLGDFLSGSLLEQQLHDRGLSTKLSANILLVGYALAIYCLVTQAIHEYVINDQGTATLGREYLGTSMTINASKSTGGIVLIAATALLLALIQMIAKSPFLREKLTEKFADIPNPSTDNPLAATVSPIVKPDEVYDLEAAYSPKGESKLDV